MRNEKIFDAVAWWVHKRGVRPDHLTMAQAPVYAVMAVVGWFARDRAGLLLAFAGLQLLVVLLDGADGILARRTGTASRRGHLLDSVFDVVGIGLTLLVALHLHPEENVLVILLLLVNFVVYVQNEIQGTKAITYTRGPVTLGLLLGPAYPWAVRVGILLPLVFGSILLVLRVDWRKRLWNYYQFLTAGRRAEYKATPRPERAGLSHSRFAEPPGSPRKGGPGGRPSDEPPDGKQGGVSEAQVGQTK